MAGVARGAPWRAARAAGHVHGTRTPEPPRPVGRGGSGGARRKPPARPPPLRASRTAAGRGTIGCFRKETSLGAPEPVLGAGGNRRHGRRAALDRPRPLGAFHRASPAPAGGRPRARPRSRCLCGFGHVTVSVVMGVLALVLGREMLEALPALPTATLAFYPLRKVCKLPPRVLRGMSDAEGRLRAPASATTCGPLSTRSSATRSSSRTRRATRGRRRRSADLERIRAAARNGAARSSTRRVPPTPRRPRVPSVFRESEPATAAPRPEPTVALSPRARAAGGAARPGDRAPARRGRQRAEPRHAVAAPGRPRASRWRSPRTARARSRLVDRHGFDLVLLDVMMPGLSGIEVLRARARALAGVRPARDDGDRARRDRGRGRGAAAGGQRLRDEAARLRRWCWRASRPSSTLRRQKQEIRAARRRPRAAQPLHPPAVRPLPERRGRGGPPRLARGAAARRRAAHASRC